MGGGGQMQGQQPMFQQPMFPQPPINIHLVNGNNNRTEPVVTSGGSGNGIPSQGNTQFAVNSQSAGNMSSIENTQSTIPDIDSFLSKPMINRSNQGGSRQEDSNDALDSLGNGKVSFVVKKI
jgi:hypothetical protein